MNFRALFVMGDMLTYGALSMPYSFVINHDRALNVFAARWKDIRDQRQSDKNFIGDNIHPDVGLPYFDTMEEAVEACEQQLKRMTEQPSVGNTNAKSSKSSNESA